MSKIFIKLVLSLSVILSNRLVNCAPNWDKQDINTLKLLQIVHRHGERTVLKNNMPVSDPFRNVTKYWQDGFGELTEPGKSRMYKEGTYLREWYKGYLGGNNSPREVYARSSLEHRCIESVSCLLSGMYPPKDKWKWDSQANSLGDIWQPFPIETYMPKDEDTLLVPHKKCPKADDEHKIINDLPEVKKIISDFKNKTIYPFLKELFKDPIDSLYRGQQFWDTLKIENESNYMWPNLNSSTFTQAIDALKPLGLGSYVYDWNRDFLRKIRLGKLVETLITNMQSVIKDHDLNEKKKVYVYSTHDSIVVPLMQTIGNSPALYNGDTPPYGAALLLELHQDNSGHSVKVYYYNKTESIPFAFLNESFEAFESRNKKWYYTDFDKECGIKSGQNLILSEMTFMVIGIAIGIGLVGLNIIAVNYIRSRKRSFEISR